MPSAWQGLSQGLDRGLRLGMALEGAQDRREDRTRRMGREDTLWGQQQEDRSRRQSREDLTADLTKMQIKSLKDDKKRKKLSDSNNALLYSLTQMQEDPNAYSDYLQKNPGESKRLQKAIQEVGGFAFGDSGKAGDVEPIDLEPVGENENGEMMFSFKVKTADGSESVITKNRGKLLEGDEKTTFTLDEIGQNSGALKALISQVESQQVASGDMGPLNRLRANKAAQSAAKSKEGIATLKHKRALELESVKKSDKDKLVDIGVDPLTGEKRWARYDPQTKQLVPVTGEQGGLGSLPPDQQRLVAIQMMEQQGTQKEESNYLGMGDDTYSDDQINTFIGSQSMGGQVSPATIGQQAAQQGDTAQPTEEDFIKAVMKSNPTYTREQVIQAIKADPKLNGQPPTETQPTQAPRGLSDYSGTRMPGEVFSELGEKALSGIKSFISPGSGRSGPEQRASIEANNLIAESKERKVSKKEIEFAIKNYGSRMLPEELNYLEQLLNSQSGMGRGK